MHTLRYRRLGVWTSNLKVSFQTGSYKRRSICVLMTAKGYQLLRRGPFHNSPPPRFVPFVTRESFQISTSKVHIVNCGREYVRAGLV